MEKKERSKWTNKFRELGKKKGSRADFVKLYKEMKKKLVMSKYDYKNNKFLEHYVCTTILKPIS